MTPPLPPPVPPPLPSPASAPSGRQLALAALGAELTPAKTLQRLDAATARIVSTVTVVATLLTGLGLLAAGLATLTTPTRSWHVAVFRVPRRGGGAGRPNRHPHLGVKYQQPARGRTLVPAPILATGPPHLRRRGTAHPGRCRRRDRRPDHLGAVGGYADPGCHPHHHPATPPATAAGGTVTVDVTFRGLEPGQVATATLTLDGTLVATTAFGPGPEAPPPAPCPPTASPRARPRSSTPAPGPPPESHARPRPARPPNLHLAMTCRAPGARSAPGSGWSCRWRRSDLAAPCRSSAML